jgi:hypothetical protein
MANLPDADFVLYKRGKEISSGFEIDDKYADVDILYSVIGLTPAQLTYEFRKLLKSSSTFFCAIGTVRRAGRGNAHLLNKSLREGRMQNAGSASDQWQNLYKRTGF